MKVIKLTAKSDKDGQLHLNIPTTTPNQKVELVISFQSIPAEQKNSYDFSDLRGKMKWKGNSLKTQQKLRREW